MSITRINRMAEPRVTPASDGRVTITVPIQIKRSSGRKLVAVPNGGGATYQARTEANHPDGMAILGVMYLYGNCVEKDGRQAETWLS